MMSKLATEPETTFEAEKLPGVDYISHEEAIKLFDDLAHEYFGITGEEFIRRYRGGEIEDYCDNDVIMLATMISWTEPLNTPRRNRDESGFAGNKNGVRR